MTDPIHLLAIDQGTTSTRAIVFDHAGRPVAGAQQEFRQRYPADGWVEHDPEDLWRSTVDVCRQALAQCAKRDQRVTALGITNQRETTVVWNRRTGRPVYNAIVWQDRRTAERCTVLREQGHEARVTAATGLRLDPYFSATKIAWILDHVAGARSQAERGELAFGTTDSFLIWRLTGGTVHATDATNASRTALFDIHRQCWSEALLALFGVPAAMLPEVRDSAADFGTTGRAVLGTALPIRGVAGDQQAATVGQACFEPGMIKSTYGTGCFMLINTGTTPVASTHRLLTTVAYRLNGIPHYALEGSIFNAGTALQWLRDGLGIIETAADSEALASTLDSNRGVYLVPAFTGLGAPHWNPHARGALFGLTRDTGRVEFARAALESVCYQTHDLVTAMCGDGARIGAGAALRVDGGMVANDWLLQRLADTIAMPVERPAVLETTALGAACLAGLGAGVYGSLDEIAAHWQLEQRFTPTMAPTTRDRDLAGWQRAVYRVQT